MKSFKIFLVLLALGLGNFSCSGTSLLNQNENSNNSGSLPANTLFAQIEIPANHKDFETDEYRVHLDQAAIILGKINFKGIASQGLLHAQHEGHDHEEEEENPENTPHQEPSSCNYQNSFDKFIYLNLLENNSLPCIQLVAGTYQALEFEFPELINSDNTLLLPTGITHSLFLTGSALQVSSGRLYSFSVQGNLNEKIRLTQNLNLTHNAHHLKIIIEVKDWFHEINFSSLEELSESVVREISLEHNTEVYEHLSEHLVDSFSIELEE